MIKTSVKKGVKKEIVMCKEMIHHTKQEEAIAKANEMALAQMLQNIHQGHHSFGYECDEGADSDFELPPDAWIPPPASKSSKCMSTEISAPPFVVPDSVENHETINEILRFSLRQQKEDEISDNAAVVSHLVSRCLTAAGIQNRIAYGYRRIRNMSSDPHKRGKPNPGETDACLSKSPHVWLIIEGHIIDNTYIKDMSAKICKNLTKHTPSCYEEKTFEFLSTLEEVTSDKGVRSVEKTAHLMRTVMEKRIEFCMRRPDMALALAHNNEHFYNFFFSMIRYMYEEHGVSIKGIDPNIRLVCWWCESYPQKGRDLYSDTLAIRLGNLGVQNGSQGGGADGKAEPISTVTSLCQHSWRFLQCARCMVANYCSQNCQRRDWAHNHQATCLSRGSVFLPPISNIPYGAG